MTPLNNGKTLKFNRNANILIKKSNLDNSVSDSSDECESRIKLPSAKENKKSQFGVKH